MQYNILQIMVTIVVVMKVIQMMIVVNRRWISYSAHGMGKKGNVVVDEIKQKQHARSTTMEVATTTITPTGLSHCCFPKNEKISSEENKNLPYADLLTAFLEQLKSATR